jgi:hypothetical protein
MSCVLALPALALCPVVVTSIKTIAWSSGRPARTALTACSSSRIVLPRPTPLPSYAACLPLAASSIRSLPNSPLDARPRLGQPRAKLAPAMRHRDCVVQLHELLCALDVCVFVLRLVLGFVFGSVGFRLGVRGGGGGGGGCGCRARGDEGEGCGGVADAEGDEVGEEVGELGGSAGLGLGLGLGLGRHG